MKLRRMLAVFAILLAAIVVGCEDTGPSPQPPANNEGAESLEQMGEEKSRDAEDAAGQMEDDASNIIE